MGWRRSIGVQISEKETPWISIVRKVMGFVGPDIRHMFHYWLNDVVVSPNPLFLSVGLKLVS